MRYYWYEHRLTQELSEAYKKESLLLTAAVAAGKDTIEKAYEIDKLGL